MESISKMPSFQTLKRTEGCFSAFSSFQTVPKGSNWQLSPGTGRSKKTVGPWQIYWDVALRASGERLTKNLEVWCLGEGFTFCAGDSYWWVVTKNELLICFIELSGLSYRVNSMPSPTCVGSAFSMCHFYSIYSNEAFSLWRASVGFCFAWRLLLAGNPHTASIQESVTQDHRRKEALTMNNRSLPGLYS